MVLKGGDTLGRRGVLGIMLGGLAATGCEAGLSPSRNDLAEVGPDMLRRDIRRYVELGFHRSGGDADESTARWIGRRLAALGYSVKLDALSIETLAYARGELTVVGRRHPAFPQWRPRRGALPCELVRPLAILETEGLPAGSIAVETRPALLSAYWTAAHESIARRAAAVGASALVIAIADPADRLFVCNRDAAEPALPLPVALVSPPTLAGLAAAARRGATARLVLNGVDVTRETHTVVARKAGIGQAIVVSTPLNGWFGCGAERGPGVALLLAIARSLAASPRPVVLLGTGGHEIGHLGMKRALLNAAPPPADTAFWLHLGAGIAATALDRSGAPAALQLAVATDRARDGLERAVRSLGFSLLDARADSPGEMGQVVASGYSAAAALLGVFSGFHTDADNGSAVDFVKLDRVRQAIEQMLADVASNFADKPNNAHSTAIVAWRHNRMDPH